MDVAIAPVEMETPDPQGFFRLLTEAERSNIANVTPPLPATTRFDSNPEERAAYLRWYAEGYRFGLTGKMVHALWGQFPHREAVIAGWDTGQGDGWLAWSKKTLVIDPNAVRKNSANNTSDGIRQPADGSPKPSR